MPILKKKKAVKDPLLERIEEVEGDIERLGAAIIHQFGEGPIANAIREISVKKQGRAK